MNDLNDRMSAAEYVIYKTETPDTRFTAIYDKLTHVEATREKDVEDNKYLRSSIEKRCDEVLFEIDVKIKGLEQYKAQYDSQAKRMNEIKDQMCETIEAQVVKV